MRNLIRDLLCDVLRPLGIGLAVGWAWAPVLSGCAANKPHVDNEIEATVSGGEYGACTVKIKATDGGTFRDWEKCACGVDQDHHVDSGKCAP